MKKVHHQIAKSPAKSLFVWFLGLIAVGTLLLMMPVCHTSDAKPFSVCDAAFTATSASCVTGLSVRSTPNDFSLLGQIVILLLIQLGGLGIITVATVFYVDLIGRGTPEQRAVIADTLGMSQQDDLTKYVNGVVKVTLLIEGAGALILLARRIFVDDPGTALWWSLFHSISAFCNAGFALHDDSLSSCVADPTVNLTIILLILLGGIGYPVIRELVYLPRRAGGTRWSSLSFHTKLTLLVSVVLVVGGAFAFWILERNNTLSEMSTGGAFWASWFQGVTPRTAGFNTLPMGEFTNATLLLIFMLMIIGGNSCSTAGGTKVSTISIVWLNTLAHLRGREEAVMFGYRIPRGIVAQAAIIILGYLLFAKIGLLAIVCIEEGGIPHSNTGGIFLDAFFEVASALATVGLSTGFTSQLSEPSRWVIMFLMFAGRIGPLAVIAALSKPKVEAGAGLPEANPLIG
jgi:trk system potassium uptake protein TrkH